MQVMANILTRLLAKDWEFEQARIPTIGPSRKEIQSVRVGLIAAFMRLKPTDRQWKYFGEHAYQPVLQHFADVTKAWVTNGSILHPG